MAGHLTSVDYVILGLYLAGVLLLGLALSHRVGTGLDFFLAGRRLPWWAIGFSLVATDIGGTDIIGVGGAAYAYGMAVANFEWLGCIPAMIIAAFIFIPLFWRSGVYTIPEFLERRYNSSVRSALALCWLVFMACNVGIMLFASGRMLETLFGWSLPFSIIATAIVVGIYTFSGGLAAVVYTDVIQCVVMIGGCLLVLILGLVELGGPSALIEKVQAINSASATAAASRPEPEHLQLILPLDTASPFPWPAILFGLGFILGPAYWIGNQAIVQRSLGARTEFEAKAAYVFGALLKNLMPIIIAVPGLIALVKFPDLQHSDAAFPTLVAQLLPVGARGLFLAAFLAALMSSVDSYLNSAATVLTNDFYKRFLRPTASQVTLLKVGRATTVVLMLWAVGFAYLLSIQQSSGVYAIFQTLMAFFQGPALAIILAGVFSNRTTAWGAFAGFVAGVACTVTLFAMNLPALYVPMGWTPLFKVSEPFLYFSIWGFLTALTVAVIISCVTPKKPGHEIEKLIYRFGRATQ